LFTLKIWSLKLRDVIFSIYFLKNEKKKMKVENDNTIHEVQSPETKFSAYVQPMDLVDLFEYIFLKYLM